MYKTCDNNNNYNNTTTVRIVCDLIASRGGGRCRALFRTVPFGFDCVLNCRSARGNRRAEKQRRFHDAFPVKDDRCKAMTFWSFHFNQTRNGVGFFPF